MAFALGEPLLLALFSPLFPSVEDDVSPDPPLEQAESARRAEAASAPNAAARERWRMVEGPPSGHDFAGRTGQLRFTLHLL
ncbi:MULTISPECIES: hypothetical protein [unclassified Streptomyces]|uniref:hypothetical protein n=1 Tax=unclassified Streptomyces TaxID=2593676 RepID=UPI00340CBA12